MSLNEAQGNLSKSTKELLLHWQRTRGRWRDGRADAFEKNVLEALDTEVRQALTAMSRMQASVADAKVRVAPPAEL